jgi:hypothetical protein
MKRLAKILLVGLLLPLLNSCYSTWEPDPMQVSAYQPIFMTRAQLEASVTKQDPQPISDPGKLYSYGNYILINEKYKGVHIIDNQNPENPQNIAFIQVPGNIDFAMKSNVMYVDNAVDMVAINLTDLNNPVVTSRIPDAFPSPTPPDGLWAEYDRTGLPEDAIIVGWELKVK